jgi:Response regulator receiver domain
VFSSPEHGEKYDSGDESPILFDRQISSHKLLFRRDHYCGCGRHNLCIDECRWISPVFLTAKGDAMKPRILIAEADALHAAACRAFLTAEGVECETVHSGLDCLAWMRQKHADALVLDMDLPWGSGLGVLEVLREENRLANTPVVFLLDWPIHAPGRGDGIAALKGRYALEPHLTGVRMGLLFKPASPLTVTAALVGSIPVGRG